jgi:hypothetical protein
MPDVLVQMAGGGNVLHEERPARAQGGMDVGQQLGRLRLIVDGVKAVTRSNASGACMTAHPHLEPHVPQVPALRLPLSGGDPLLGDVQAQETAAREPLGQVQQGAATPTADIKHVDTPAQALRESGHQRQDVLPQCRHNGLAAVFGHHLLEAFVRGVGHAPAMAERLKHFILDSAQYRDVLSKAAMLPGSGLSGQTGGVLRGRRKVLSWGLCSTMPAVVIAPSHSRT